MSRTYLVTGGAGFIGRYLCRELLAHGFRVRVLDSLIEQVHGGGSPELPDGVEFVGGDVCDEETVARVVTGVDGIFHLAAEVGVGQSMYEIARYVRTNELGTAVLLEQVSRNPVRRIVVASSMSVYGEGAYRTGAGVPIVANRSNSGGSDGNWDPAQPDGTPLEPIPTAETKPVELASIYALTKYAQERSCLILARAYNMQAVALRVFNVFGPGQALSNPYTGVLANFGARLRNGRPPIVFEDGQQRRDFVHVADVARGFRLAMESPAAAGHVINIGSGRVYTIAGVAEMLATAMGVPHVRPQILHKARSGDIRHCFADIGKARALLGYAPQRILEDSLRELAAWIDGSEADDRGDIMRHQLQSRRLVA